MDFVALFQNNTCSGRLPGETSYFYSGNACNKELLNPNFGHHWGKQSHAIFLYSCNTLLAMKSGTEAFSTVMEIKAIIHCGEAKKKKKKKKNLEYMLLDSWTCLVL